MGEYDKIVRDSLKIAPEKRNLTELFYLSLSYYHLKDYNSFTESSNLFLSNYKERFHGLPQYTKEEALAMIFCMKAKVLLDFGKHENAQLIIQKAEDLIPEFHFRVAHSYYFKNIVEVFGTAGLVHALSGDRKKSENYKKKIGELSYASVLDNPLSKKVAWYHKLSHATIKMDRYSQEMARISHQLSNIKTQKEFRSIEMGALDNAYYDDKITAIAKIDFANKQYAAAKDILEKEMTLLSINVVADAFQKISMNITEGLRKERLYINISKLFMLTKCHFELGDLDAAKKGYEDILKYPQVKNMGDIYWVTLLDLGLIYELNQNRIKALEMYRSSIEIIEAQRSSINSEASRIGFVGDKQKAYYHLVKILFEEHDFAQAFEYIERSKARALVDILASKSQFKGSQHTIGQINNLLKELSDAELESIKIVSLEGENDSTHNTRAIAIEKISKVSSELKSLITVESYDSKDLQSLIPPDETILEYYLYGQNLYVIIATAYSVSGIKLDGTMLDSQVNDFREAILYNIFGIRGLKKTAVYSKSLRRQNILTFYAKSRLLYKKLFDPIEKNIPTKKITIVPHGTLHYLPFNALLAADGYLIENYNLRVLPSLSTVKHLSRPENSKTQDLLILGNPDLGNSEYDLPFAQDEAMALKNVYSDSRVLLRERATETALKRYGTQFNKIHVASHGTFNADDALNSGLLLSRDDKNDGILTVSELYDMNLNASLVTLSACETALGKVSNGDDVVGFSRGLFYAGTRSIVASLWKVDDKATSILMQEFYESMRSKDKRSALRNAQLKVKNEYNHHPFFWAAFQLIGAAE